MIPGGAHPEANGGAPQESTGGKATALRDRGAATHSGPTHSTRPTPTPTVPDGLPLPAPGLFGQVLAFWQLGKPRLSLLNIVAVFAGAWLPFWEVYPAGAPDTFVVASACIGAFLVAVAANAFNMWIERDLDRRMARTSGRPLPSGRLSPRAVFTYGVVCSTAGLGLMAIGTNWLATGLTAGILVSYTCIYTPLKRVTTLNTLVGAIPGALPPVVGYAAVMGQIDTAAWTMFLIVFFWQVPHFLAIAWQYRHDYAAAGMKMLPVLDPDGVRTGRQMLAWTLGLMVASLLPVALGMRSDVYAAAAMCLNILFFVPVLLAAVLRWESAMRLSFRVSLLYLPGILAALVFCPTPG